MSQADIDEVQDTLLEKRGENRGVTMSEQDEKDEKEFEEWYDNWLLYGEGQKFPLDDKKLRMKEAWLASRRTLREKEESQEKKIEELENDITNLVNAEPTISHEVLVNLEKRQKRAEGRVKELEEGIKKHRDSDKIFPLADDAELYKLLKK